MKLWAIQCDLCLHAIFLLLSRFYVEAIHKQYFFAVIFFFFLFFLCFSLRFVAFLFVCFFIASFPLIHTFFSSFFFLLGSDILFRKYTLFCYSDFYDSIICLLYQCFLFFISSNWYFKGGNVFVYTMNEWKKKNVHNSIDNFNVLFLEWKFMRETNFRKLKWILTQDRHLSINLRSLFILQDNQMPTYGNVWHI